MPNARKKLNIIDKFTVKLFGFLSFHSFAIVFAFALSGVHAQTVDQSDRPLGPNLGAGSSEEIRLINVVRNGIRLDPMQAIQYFGRDVRPDIAQVIDWNTTLTNFLPGTIAVLSCIGTQDDTWTIGYYNPVWHTWLIVNLNANGQIIDADIGKGLSLTSKDRTDWSALAHDFGGIPQGLQAASFLQISAFTALFPRENCVPFDVSMRSFDRTAGAGQFLSFQLESQRIPVEFVDHVIERYATEGELDPSVFYHTGSIQTSDTTWISFLGTWDSQGGVYASRWHLIDGEPTFDSNEFIPFIPLQD